MKNAITTAVIAAAGQGTRMWPSTKVVSKELFPLGRIPAIIHVVWELVDAGIDTITIVTSPHNRDEMSRLLDASAAPPSKFADDQLALKFQRTISRCSISLIEQRGDYGNGTPLLLAAEHVGIKPCIYAFGDDVVVGENATKGLIDKFHQSGCSVLAAQPVEAERRHSFGIIECHGQDVEYVTRFLEKPGRGETLSNLASFGRYLITPLMLDLMNNVGKGRDGEVWFTDAVRSLLSSGGSACVFRLTSGRWYTVGDPASYAEAVRAATAEQLGTFSRHRVDSAQVEAV